MGVAKKYNKGQKFEVDTTGYKYVGLSDLVEQGAIEKDVTFTIQGMFISHGGKYGDSPVLIEKNGLLVNLPKHKTKLVEALLMDDEAIEQIKADGLGFKIYSYLTKDGKEYYSINLVDIPVKAEEEPLF